MVEKYKPNLRGFTGSAKSIPLIVPEGTLTLVPSITSSSASSFRLNSIRLPRIVRKDGLPDVFRTSETNTLDICSLYARTLNMQQPKFGS